jgi:hypothetical protein
MPSLRRLRSPTALALALLLVFASLAVSSLRRKAVTVDEIAYVAAGYYHWKTGDFDYNSTNPPLLKLLCGLPLLALDLDLPAREGDPAGWGEIRQWQYAREFLYSNRVDADTILLLARLPVVALGVLLGLGVFLWARQLYGGKSALVALFLYALCPNVLAHARLATQDLGVAAFAFASAWALWAFFRSPSFLRILACGLSVAAASLSKTSATVLIPIGVAYTTLLLVRSKEAGIWTNLAIVRRVPEGRPRIRQFVSLGVAAAAVAGIFLLGLNAGYAFEGSFRPLSETIPPDRLCQRLGVESGSLRGIVGALLDLPSPVPEPFLRLLKFQVGRVQRGASMYMAGELSSTGWWTMMPFAFAIKTPIPLLLLAAASSWKLLRRRDVAHGEWLLAIAAGTVLALFTALRSVGIGLRYVLPMFPFLHVLASGVAREGSLRSRWRRVALGVLLLWQAIGTLRIHPDYLAHFNEFVGGPSNGYRYLVDSNLDWGQDLKALKEYLDRNGIPRIRLAYFGSADASYYGIDYEYLPSVGLTPKGPGARWWYETDESSLPPLDPSRGPIAVSATLLVGVFYPGYYAPLLDRRPRAQIGHSILVYDGE